MTVYPRARFTFHDGAIGGTGSQLGVFCLQRDVLRYQPDLVFIDGKYTRGKTEDAKDAPHRYSAGASKSLGDGDHARVITTGLELGIGHTLEIEPVWCSEKEWRLGNVCVLGCDARFLRFG